MKTILRMILLIVLYFTLNTSSFANSSSYYDKDGVTVVPLENKSIVMQKEIVRIIPYPSDNIKWLATCEFQFYNKSKTEEQVTMGYPDWLNSRYNPGRQHQPNRDKNFWKFFDTLPEDKRQYYKESMFVTGYGHDFVYAMGYKEGKLPYVNSAWNLHDLKVSIDDKSIETTHRPISTKINIRKKFNEEFAANISTPVGAYIWKITFKPGERKIVAVSFEGLRDVAGYQEASYILKTGALWADKIKEADIYWDINGRDIDPKRIFPTGYKIEKQIIHWHFENFEPVEDISIFNYFIR